MEIKLSVKGYKCERCPHQWIPRKKKYPVTCPKCKSPYWDKHRVNKIKEKEKHDTKTITDIEKESFDSCEEKEMLK